MSNDPTINLGKQIVSMLTEGARTTTYKHALVLALLDYSVENLPKDPQSTLTVPIDDLADKVIGYYWRQLKPFGTEGLLSQGKGKSSHGSILQKISELQSLVDMKKTPTAPAAKESLDPKVYQRYRRNVATVLAKMPIPRLQIKGKKDQFHNKPLFDVAWKPDEFKISDGDACNWTITLHPWVAFRLATLSPLLRPFIEQQWRNDVIRFNPANFDESSLDNFLFGCERSNFDQLRPHLVEFQSNSCFYCNNKFTNETAHVDHVLPWSLTSNDGVTNLVAADSKCNINKSNHLPIYDHVLRAVTRPESEIDSIAKIANLASLRKVTINTANGIYRTTAPGEMLWKAYKDEFEPHEEKPIIL